MQRGGASLLYPPPSACGAVIRKPLPCLRDHTAALQAGVQMDGHVVQSGEDCGMAVRSQGQAMVHQAVVDPAMVGPAMVHQAVVDPAMVSEELVHPACTPGMVVFGALSFASAATHQHPRPATCSACTHAQTTPIAPPKPTHHPLLPICCRHFFGRPVPLGTCPAPTRRPWRLRARS